MAFGSGSVLVTRSTHDALGRTVETVENYTGGSITATANKTTQFTYDGAGHLLTYKLLLPSSAYQETQYVYGIATSTISSNDLLAQVWHPNKSTGAASSSEADVYDYDAIGAVATSTDRNGTTHTYTNDILGRRIYDWVTAYGSGVDTTIDALVTTYDGQGNASAFLSLDGYAPGNTVFREFNGWGQMTKEYQDHAWYPSGSTPVMQYRYAEMPSGANYSRLDGFEYPSPGEFDQEYDYSGVDDRISRVSVVHLKGDADVLSLAYLGAGTVVYMTNPVTFRTYIGSGTGDGGDQYVGLDRFGRVVDLTWSTGGGGGAVNDRYQYGYDRDSNRLWRDNVQNSAFGELYAYDDLNQLTSMQRGTLNGTKTGLTGSASRSQSWSADGAGNFTGVTTDGTGQSRSYNAQNQFTALGSASPTYDANGNLLTDGTWTYTYDAWNRLATATDGTTTVTYRYDALGRRVTETTGGVTTHLYYNQNWQVIEERVGGTASTNLRAQYVWSPVESDVLIYRDRDTNADGELDERLYVQQDVQGNVTALVNTAGAVVERYAYDAYGKATPYTVTWGTPSGGGTQYAWQYLHQGLRYDAADGLYDNRARVYSATYMRFLQNDPTWFAAGDANIYRYQVSSPVMHADPSGLCPFDWEPGWWPWSSRTKAADAQKRRASLEVKFLDWFLNNLDTSWADNLPACPCSIGRFASVMKKGYHGVYERRLYITNPDPDVWDEPTALTIDFVRTFVADFHPGAVFEMRSKPLSNGTRQQCTYDAKGKLITHGPGAGTADRGGVFSTHQPLDVEPAKWALELDGGKPAKYYDMYIAVRPIDSKNKCPKNP